MLTLNKSIKYISIAWVVNDIAEAYTIAEAREKGQFAIGYIHGLGIREIGTGELARCKELIRTLVRQVSIKIVTEGR